ncbi:hypothetical protein AMR72_16355 [Flavobacterium psychrophilum]|nr:hypothetical protein AMR72_16355 [Flavobacterium psychrophilum]AOE53937.1 hypothetical protein ALW18_16345 [Flavobacterium psychrophilum]
MNIVKRNSSELAVYQPQGLGFLGINLKKWAGKAIRFVGGIVERAVRSFIPLFGDDIAERIYKLVDSWANTLENAKPGLNAANDGEITAQEESILDYWLNYEFVPFVESLIQEVASAMTLPTNASKLIAFNAVLNKVAAVNAHYLVDGVVGLSQNAREQRSVVVYQSLDPVIRTVQLAVANSNMAVNIVPVEFNLNVYDFAPLFYSSIVTTVKGENYKSSTILRPVQGSLVISQPFNPIRGGTISIGSQVKTPVSTPVSTPTPATNPVKPVQTATPVVTLPVKTPVITVPTQTTTPVSTPTPTPVATTPTPVETPVVTLPTGSGNSSTNNNAEPEKKSNTGLYIGLGLLGLAAAAAALKGKDKKTSKTKK